MSEKKAKELNLKPLAEIISHADAANEPRWFTTAPSKALPIALNRANLDLSQIDLLEINEAFSVVTLANLKIQKNGEKEAFLTRNKFVHTSEKRAIFR